MVDLQSRVPGGSAANVVKGIAGLAALRGGSTTASTEGGNAPPPCAFVGKVRHPPNAYTYLHPHAHEGPALLGCMYSQTTDENTDDARTHR